MDTIIRQIIDIDKKASEIMVRTEERIKESENAAKLNIENMKSDIIENAKAEASEVFDSILEEARKEADRIREASQEECSMVESSFSKVREAIVDKIFSEIIDLNMRDYRE